MNNFEQASRQKLRFSTNKGDLTVEQLWDLPLQSKTQFDLDTVAKNVNNALKGATEESFVNTTTNPAKARLELMMDVVKHIIAARLAENEAVRDAMARKNEREKLLGILADKQDEALKSLTPEQIKERLAALG